MLKNNIILVIYLLSTTMLCCADTKLNTKLIAAIEKNNLQEVKQLVESGADVNAQKNSYNDGYTALMLATKNSNTEIVDYLIAHNVDVNAQVWIDNSRRDFDDRINTTALLLAACCDNIEIIKSLINAGADITFKNKYGTTALQTACFSGKIENVKILFSTNNTFDKTDINESLFTAAYNGNLEIIKYIMTNISIDPAIKNKMLLDGTRGSKKMELIKFIINSGADINAQDNCKTTPLIKATLNGDRELIIFLIAAGANINAQDHLNRNALHYATYNNNADLVQLFVDAGIDTTPRDNQGYTALSFAERVYGKNCTIATIINAGRTIGIEQTFFGSSLEIWLAKMRWAITGT